MITAISQIPSNTGVAGRLVRKYRVTDYCSFFSSASGGTVTYSGSYKIHTFTSNSTFTIQSSITPFEVLIVGGGGGGATDQGGGGGGGAILYSSGITLGVDTYTVTVGAAVAKDTQGNNSSLVGTGTFNAIALGGAKGVGTNATGVAGGNGGGGGGSYPGTTLQAGGTASQTSYNSPFGTLTGYGNRGGNGYGRHGGGGGGCGSAGSDANVTTPNGGNGLAFSTSGSSVTYGGGGGGGGDAGPGAGGTGGGATGSASGTGGTGTNGLGGGGGGGGSGTQPGGGGGSGVVIIKYQYQP